MTLNNNPVRRTESPAGHRATPGWTALHSWVFLVIVAIGLSLIVLQNRYHYLSPLGLGKAYRIDKLFGSIQEFDPAGGWITAQLQPIMPQPPSSMPEPPSPRAMPGAAPEPQPAPSVQPPKREIPSPAVKETPLPERKEVKQTLPREKPGDTREDRLQSFLKTYPDFGEEEFQLANDDLFPDWKKKVAPNGTWSQFLVLYGEFFDRWMKAGSPPDPGPVWNDFLASQKKR